MNSKNTQNTVRIFRALSVDKRLDIVMLLAERTLCVGALSGILGISAGAVSQHLRILKDSGLVVPDRRGFFTHYSLAPGAALLCRTVINSLFETKTASKKGDRKCAVTKKAVRNRKNSKASRGTARRNK